MALTEFQRNLCRLIARNRIDRGEAYIAGGAALAAALGVSRVSRDIDLFHDTREALAETLAADVRLLRENGYEVNLLHERPAYAEALVVRGRDSVVIQWTCDSAYRFFPLVEHPDLGLTLHPFDLATNKALALIGRAEVRDWIDTIECHRLLQPLGYLTWAACGKDPALNPKFILEQARRTARYTQAEIDGLAFDGPVPDAAALSTEWKRAVEQAEVIHAVLPPDRAGCCVLGGDLALYAGNADALAADLSGEKLAFHAGRIGGAWPRMLDVDSH